MRSHSLLKGIKCDRVTNLSVALSYLLVGVPVVAGVVVLPPDVPFIPGMVVPFIPGMVVPFIPGMVMLLRCAPVIPGMVVLAPDVPVIPGIVLPSRATL